MNFAPGEAHLLDTTAVIFLIRRNLVVAPQALIPFVTMAELLAGVENATDSTKELDRVQAAVSGAPIIYPTFDTLESYAGINAYLRRSGKMIPTNDLWIAALALQWEIPLLTDDAHFMRVPGLKILPVR